MVIKLYISGISGNKEVKKKQQRVQMILDSKQINYEAIDITEPGKEKDKEFMQQNGKVRESLGKYPLPPQIFNDDDFCGDYEDFDLANEVDELEKFLHIETNSKEIENGSKQDENSKGAGGFYDNDKNSNESLYNPYDYHTFRIRQDGVNGLKEEIISTGSVIDEKEQNEENTKSEVNGESEIVPALDPSQESIAESVEISADDNLAPEKEESATKEAPAADENEENLGDNQEQEIKAETQEKEEESEDVENPKEEEVESHEKSPLSEQKEGETEEVAEDAENKEKIASEEEKEEENEEKEEEEEGNEEKEESDQESPESEKSQEE